jgi:hypothetical protein
VGGKSSFLNLLYPIIDKNREDKMDISRTQQVSPILSAQRIANDQQVATLKLSQDQIKQQGQSALQLIQSVPQSLPTGNVGQNINIKV